MHGIAVGKRTQSDNATAWLNMHTISLAVRCCTSQQNRQRGEEHEDTSHARRQLPSPTGLLCAPLLAHSTKKTVYNRFVTYFKNN